MFSSQKAKKQIQMPPGECAGAGPEDLQHGIDGLAADPGLDAEPAAGDQRAQHRRDVRAAHSERRAHEDRKRNAVLRAGVGVEQHGDQHDQVAEQDGADRLPPAHAAGDQAGGQHVGGNADAHRDPERGVVVGAPGAAFERDGREVLVVELRIAGRSRWAALIPMRPPCAARAQDICASRSGCLPEEFAVVDDHFAARDHLARVARTAKPSNME